MIEEENRGIDSREQYSQLNESKKLFPTTEIFLSRCLQQYYSGLEQKHSNFGRSVQRDIQKMTDYFDFHHLGQQVDSELLKTYLDESIRKERAIVSFDPFSGNRLAYNPIHSILAAPFSNTLNRLGNVLATL